MSLLRLDTAGSKDKDAQKPAATAVTVATATPVTNAPVLNISDWKTSDVHDWLKKNNLKHLQKWYDNTCHRHLVNVET